MVKLNFLSLILLQIYLQLMNTQITSKSIPRVSYKKEILNLERELRSFSIQVQAPALNQYNYIDLRKHKKNRIDHHIIMNDLPLLNKSKSHDSTQRDKWQKSLDRYILARQKLQTRKANVSGEFQFLKLDKTNKYRKKKLVEANSLPINIIKNTDLHENYSFDLNDSQRQFRLSIRMKERARQRFNTEKDASLVQTPKEKLQTSPKSTQINQNESQQQDRLMNNFMQKYFKKKYSQQLSKLPTKLKINKYNSAILRKNKNRNKIIS